MGELLDLLKKAPKKESLLDILGSKSSVPIESEKKFISQADIARQSLEEAEKDRTINISLGQESTPEQKADAADFRRRQELFEKSQLAKTEEGQRASLFEKFVKPKSTLKQITDTLTRPSRLLEEVTGANPTVSKSIEATTASGIKAIPFVGSQVVSDEEMARLRQETPTLGTIPKKVPFVGGRDVKLSDVTGIAANLGMTAYQYGKVNDALKSVNTASKLGKLMGKSKLAKFGTAQTVDVLADVIVQSPVEAFEAIKKGDSLGEFGDTWLNNRKWDIVFNALVGGAIELGSIKKLKNQAKLEPKLVSDAISKVDDVNLQKTIQEELGLTSKLVTEDALKDTRLDVDSVAKSIDQTKGGELSEILGVKSSDVAKTAELKFDDINKGFKTTVELDDGADRAFNKLLNKGYEVPEATIVQDVAKGFENYKDVGSLERYNTDVYRIYDKVFGENASKVKSVTLDKLDGAKKVRIEEEISLADSLKKDIVDKFGFKKGSKESALIQRYGEGNIDKNGLVDMVGEQKANNIIAADEWFRNKYNDLIDDINTSRIAIGKEAIPKLNDYYRHFNEISGLQGVKDLFTANKQISPQLAGISDFTKPGEKWASFKQTRKGGKFKEDAIGGFIDYVPAATYAKHIDPEITRLRTFENELRRTVGEETNINNFLEFMNDYTNALAGKTNPFDRMTQKVLGRKTFGMINKLNSRMKANSVLGNASSSLAQIANVPQAIAFVKNPKQIAGGLDGYFKSLTGGGDKALYDQSGFIKERITDTMKQFDTRMVDQPKKLAKWMLGALDETGTKFIWSSVYRKGLSEGVQNPVKYADDVTRKLVAGRGIGEVPIQQQSKLFQLVAPFTLEVSNLWKVQKDFLKNKDFAALGILFGSNFLLNEAMEDIRGSRVTFDPINAIIEGLEEGDGIGGKILSATGSLGGEVLGNVPLGQSLASVYPEYGGKVFGVDLPTRAKLFGENDPTRYGVQLPIARAIQKPISSLLLPFGGQQVRKSLEGAKSLLEGFARNKSGNIITPVDKNIESVAKGLIFGKYAIPEVKSVYESDGRAFSDKGSKNFENLVSEGFESKQLFDAIAEAKASRKKDDIVKVLEKYYNNDKINKILIDFYDFKGR